MFTQTIDKYELTINKLFLIDGLGALTSLLFLGIILPNIQMYIGLPTNYLYILCSMPVGFAIYSLGNYFLKLKQAKALLTIIGAMNLLYSVFTIIILISHSDTLLALGWIYFIAEFGIILFVSLLEFTAVKIIK